MPKPNAEHRKLSSRWGVGQVGGDHAPAAGFFLIDERESNVGICAAKADAAHYDSGVAEDAGCCLGQGCFAPAPGILSGFWKDVGAGQDICAEGGADEFRIDELLHCFSIEGSLRAEPLVNGVDECCFSVGIRIC